jgi:hypothetical protein
MVTREELREGGMRAYERGRLRAASRVAWFLIPASILCALTTGEHQTCACLGAPLFGAALYLRWRDRQGVAAVTAGLVAGTLPLLSGLVLGRLIPDCSHAPLISLCSAMCLGVGLPSGVWLGAQAARGRFGFGGVMAAVGIAVTAASLGCVGLGAAGIVGAGLGLLFGGAVTQRSLERRVRHPTD